MAPSESSARMLPGSKAWLECSPAFVYEHHPGELQGVLRVYVAQHFDNGEMADQANRFRLTAVKANTITKAITRAHEELCIEKNANPVRARSSWEKSRKKAISERQGTRSLVYCRKNEAPKTQLSNNPSLSELNAAKQQNASEEWLLKTAKVFDRHSMEDIRSAWGHAGKNNTPTINLIQDVKRRAKAIEDATSDVTPLENVKLNKENCEDINAMVSRMRGQYPPLPERKNGAKRQGPNSADYLGSEGYSIFKLRLQDLEDHVASSSTGGTAASPQQPLFSSGMDIFHFFAEQDDGIRDGETDSTIKDFCDICLNLTLFDRKYAGPDVLARFFLAVMRDAGRQVRTGFLTNLKVCILHLEGLMAAISKDVAEASDGDSVEGSDGEEGSATSSPSRKRQASLSSASSAATGEDGSLMDVEDADGGYDSSDEEPDDLLSDAEDEITPPVDRHRRWVLKLRR